jgi:hypothetical protein
MKKYLLAGQLLFHGRTPTVCDRGRDRARGEHDRGGHPHGGQPEAACHPADPGLYVAQDLEIVVHRQMSFSSVEGDC